MSDSARRYVREFARILVLVAVAVPLSALAVSYAKTGDLSGALAFSWSRVIGLIVICAIVAALPARKSAK